MKEYCIKNLRNIGFMGHGTTGKTSLVEAIAYRSGLTDRMGRVEDKNTISDFEAEEKRRGFSVSLSVVPVENKDIKINIVDMPGYFDFYGETIQGMRAVDLANIVVCGATGVQVGTEKAWDYCNKIKLSRTFFINKLDRDNSDFDKVFSELKDKFGISVVPIQYPIGKAEEFRGVINVISEKARIYNPKTKEMEESDIPENLKEKVAECKEMITEAVAETREDLLEKYFEEGYLSEEEIYTGLLDGCARGEIAPVMCGSAIKGIGINTLLEDMVMCFPNPTLSLAQKCIREDGEEDYICLDEKEKFSAFVFKTTMDPFAGKLSYFRVITGEVKNNDVVINSKKKIEEKTSNLYLVCGKNLERTDRVIAGDIGVIGKADSLETGDTIVEVDNSIVYDKLNFRNPMMHMAVYPKEKGNEDKIGIGLSKIIEEDKSLVLERRETTGEQVISGVSRLHLEVVESKLKEKFGAEVLFKKPKFNYRETITGHSDVQGKHKKQSGGHGQYGDVKIKFERRKDGEVNLEFVDNVVGGAVPRNYIPVVEKSLEECMKKGVILEYPMVELKATLYDGSSHAVDSSEMAFKIATTIAYKRGIELANPIILEPIMKVGVFTPDENMGDIISDINKRRGRILGMEGEGELKAVIAEIPESELFTYAIDLQAITAGRGYFEVEYSRHEELSKIETLKLIENKEKEE
ncbi:elongation factor G [uncultured Clostridium sp.]|uniref:elongation factor G n=1 Tax=uncultured Clostridium sp. TaxID=59620 RepID=UPI002606B04B|nr:elongation factor G [uncultured Clostridium sp.]